MTETLPQIYSADDIIRLVESIGSLPFFANHIPGFSVEEYSTPEQQFGYDFVTSAYKRKPTESRQRIAAHLKTILPNDVI